MSKPLALSIVLAFALASVGCVTPLTQEDVRQRIEDVAGAPAKGQTQRVYPIYAETKLVAWAKLTEAEEQPNQGPSLQMAKRLARAAERKQRVVVGGPYPELTDRIVANALAAHRDGGLQGLILVVVSPTPPGPALQQEARNNRIHIEHREF
jgi:hypothetical protein